MQHYDLWCTNELFHVFPQDSKSTYCLWQYTAMILYSFTQMKKHSVHFEINHQMQMHYTCISRITPPTVCHILGITSKNSRAHNNNTILYTVCLLQQYNILSVFYFQAANTCCVSEWNGSNGCIIGNTPPPEIYILCRNSSTPFRLPELCNIVVVW